MFVTFCNFISQVHFVFAEIFNSFSQISELLLLFSWFSFFITLVFHYLRKVSDFLSLFKNQFIHFFTCLRLFSIFFFFSRLWIFVTLFFHKFLIFFSLLSHSLYKFSEFWFSFTVVLFFSHFYLLRCDFSSLVYHFPPPFYCSLWFFFLVRHLLTLVYDFFWVVCYFFYKFLAFCDIFFTSL